MKCAGFGIICVLLLCPPALAEPEKLTGAQIHILLANKILRTDTVEQIFQSSGQTIYIEQGNPSHGTWSVRGDQYCSTWPPSHLVSCFDVLTEGSQVTFVASGGKQFVMQWKP